MALNPLIQLKSEALHQWSHFKLVKMVPYIESLAEWEVIYFIDFHDVHFSCVVTIMIQSSPQDLGQHLLSSLMLTHVKTLIAKFFMNTTSLSITTL